MNCLPVFATFLLATSFAASHGNEDRVEKAREKVASQLEAFFSRADVEYPPEEIYVRIFKHEAEIELWARENRRQDHRLVHTFPIAAASGKLGPKRREGDSQVPEGFYHIDRFNPQSRFHLSLGLNYPNAADKILSDAVRPGFDIFIHGGEATIGCIPLGDRGIELLYVTALDTRQNAQIPVHIFPARMSGPDWERLRARQPTLQNFWAQLEPAYLFFEREKRVPRMRVRADGDYELAVGKD